MKDFYEYYMNKVRIDSFTMLNEKQDGGFITPACGFELLLSSENGNGASYYWIAMINDDGYEIERWNTLGVATINWVKEDVLKMV